MFAGLIFGYWTKNPIGLLALYIVQWIAVISYTVLGYFFIVDTFAVTVALWAQMLVCYIVFSLKLHR